MWVIGKASRRPRRIGRATGTAASQGFRTASPMARGAAHRHATRSWPKALGSRLYESIIRTFGISYTVRPKESALSSSAAVRSKGGFVSDSSRKLLPGVHGVDLAAVQSTIVIAIGGCKPEKTNDQELVHIKASIAILVGIGDVIFRDARNLL